MSEDENGFRFRKGNCEKTSPLGKKEAPRVKKEEKRRR
jgi:hypothetical protein